MLDGVRSPRTLARTARSKHDHVAAGPDEAAPTSSWRRTRAWRHGGVFLVQERALITETAQARVRLRKIRCAAPPARRALPGRRLSCTAHARAAAVKLNDESAGGSLTALRSSVEAGRRPCRPIPTNVISITTARSYRGRAVLLGRRRPKTGILCVHASAQNVPISRIKRVVGTPALTSPYAARASRSSVRPLPRHQEGLLRAGEASWPRSNQKERCRSRSREHGGSRSTPPRTAHRPHQRRPECRSHDALTRASTTSCGGARGRSPAANWDDDVVEAVDKFVKEFAATSAMNLDEEGQPTRAARIAPRSAGPEREAARVGARRRRGGTEEERREETATA